MQLNKTKLALTMGVLFLSAASSTYAVTLSPTVDITTRDDVALAEDQVLSFGANIFTATGGVCTMDADTPGEALGQANMASAAAANFGELSGTGCATGIVATPGVYRVIGTAASAVTVTVTPVNASTDFSYSADNGCIVNYDNNATATDACIALTNATPIGAQLAGATDNGATSVPGETVITIGGTITVINAAGLTASTAYSDSFNLNVVY
jgi:hypothetical protein